MKYWILGASFIAFVLWSCQKETQALNLPIPQEKLVPVLADAYIAEAAINTLVGSVKDSMAAVYYQQLCEIHGITKADFDTTISLMQQHPIFMDSVYANVLTRLTELEGEKPDKAVDKKQTK